MQRVAAITMLLMLMLVAIAPTARAQSPSPTAGSSPSPAAKSPSPTTGSSPSPAASKIAPSPAVAPAGTRLTAITQLTGKAEVPPNPTPVTGTCNVTINNGAGNYSLSITDTTNLALVHLHTGSTTSIDAGNTTATSAVVLLYTIPKDKKVITNQQGAFTLTTNGTLNADVKTLDGLAAQIKKGNVYCDVHQVPIPPAASGKSAIRGQLVAQS